MLEAENITNDQWESHKNNLLQCKSGGEWETIKLLYNEYKIVSR